MSGIADKSKVEFAIEDSVATDSTILIEYSEECYNELLTACEDYHAGNDVTTFWGMKNNIPWQVDIENEY